ncbi:hypothetical protein GJAV_G00204870 [Gymnothorax javanicus]|nr:hypothetical protein GJAV_G00204870 [Gymnothorax javanicus]
MFHVNTGMAVKPFTPEKARAVLESLQQPAVFLGMASDWPALDWSVKHLSEIMDQKVIRFRIGKIQEEKTPLFETQCSYTEATLWEFWSWATGQSEVSCGPFSHHLLSESWAYADYKYMSMLFEEKPSMFQGVAWSDFGYPGRNGRESTLWIGTAGANTPCHLDSYGCNLVLQVQGRKRWHLFPPEDTSCLYPTRIPYEESSVFSQVHVVRPDHKRFPAFSKARAHVVTLEPGQVLFVPRHWWHYVESLDPLTVSINSWIEMEEDDEARVEEALTRTIVCALKTTPSSDNNDDWLNPTEGSTALTKEVKVHEGNVTSHDENLHYLNLALKAYTTKQGDTPLEPSSPLPTATGNFCPGKRDSEGLPKHRTHLHPPACAHFGPNLMPVPVCSERFEEHGEPDPRSPCPTDCTSESDLHRSRTCAEQPDGGAAQQADPRGGEYRPISTNDLLQFLVHPEVVALMTKLLMRRADTHGCV